MDYLVKALTDRDAYVRREAAYSLGVIGDTRAVKPLIRALKDKNKGVRSATADALGKLGDERAKYGLQRIFENELEDTVVRKKAFLALRKIT